MFQTYESWTEDFNGPALLVFETLKIALIWQERFLNKLLISVKKQQKVELTKEQGWFSEGELTELGWSKSGSHF